MTEQQNVVSLFDDEDEVAEDERRQWREEEEQEIQNAKNTLGPDIFKKRVDEAIDNILFLHWVTISYHSVPTSSGMGIPEHVEKGIKERFPDFFPHYMKLVKKDASFKTHLLDSFMMYCLINGSHSKEEPWSKGVSTAQLQYQREGNIMPYLRWLDEMGRKGRKPFKGKYPGYKDWKKMLLTGTWDKQ